MHYEKIAHYLWQAVQSTISQLAILLGPGLALAFVMHLLAGHIAERACRVIGRDAFLLLFGWLGTIIHEGGHALFCLLFGHRITAVKWFDFSCSDGTLGHVRHSYDRNSMFQRIGNFFIGIGPILLGTVLFYAASRYLLEPEVFVSLRQTADSAQHASIHSVTALAHAVAQSCGTIFSAIFTPRNLVDWKFWLFLYLTFSIGSSITLSPQDIQGASSGFFALAGMLLVFNVVTNWLGVVPESVFRGVSHSCGVFYLAMAFAIFVNALVAAILLVLPMVKR